MKQLTILNGFTKMRDANLELRAQEILASMTDNANFPAPSPDLETFGLAIIAFSNALVASREGGRLQVAIKNQKRDELTALLHLLGDYVLFKSAGDNVIATSSGFSIGKQPSPAPPITKPENLRVMQGENSGELISRIKTVKGAIAYLYQYATDAMMAQNNWQWITCSRTDCTITDLQPGTKYNIRVAAVGRKDQLVYSDIVSRIAV